MHRPDKVVAQNHATMQQSLLIGSAAGLATGLVLALAGSSIHPHQPAGPAGGGASLGLEAGPTVARLVFRVGF